MSSKILHGSLLLIERKRENSWMLVIDFKWRWKLPWGHLARRGSRLRASPPLLSPCPLQKLSGTSCPPPECGKDSMAKSMGLDEFVRQNARFVPRRSTTSCRQTSPTAVRRASWRTCSSSRRRQMRMRKKVCSSQLSEWTPHGGTIPVWRDSGGSRYLNGELDEKKEGWDLFWWSFLFLKRTCWTCCSNKACGKGPKRVASFYRYLISISSSRCSSLKQEIELAEERLKQKTASTISALLI